MRWILLAFGLAGLALSSFAAEPHLEIPFDVVGMWEKTQAMLHDSIDALVNLDAGLANRVCAQDSTVDQMKRENRKRAEAIMRQERVRHVPVVDGKTLIGMISIGDVNAYNAAEDHQNVEYLTQYIHGRA